MNPDDPESAQHIVEEYVRLLEQHAETQAHPVSSDSLPYAKQTIKSAVLTCVTHLRQQHQLTDELLDFLEGAYIALADYIDDELVRVLTEYRDATAALTDVASARDKVQTPAWQRVAEMSGLAGEIAKTVANETVALRLEFREAQLSV